MSVPKHYDSDVVIIGAGGAGLRAAIAARDCGARVLVVCKSLLGKAHTVMAEGGIAAALGTVDSRDNWSVHFRDTLLGGKMLNDWRAAELHAKEAPEEVLLLERWGALFDRTGDGRILQRLFGGHSFARLAHIGDRTGLEMLRTLQDTAVARGIEVLMEHTVTKIDVRDGVAVGAIGYERQTGAVFAVSAPSIIIASGGAGRLYSVNSNSWETTGDGQSLAFRAGAELTDMEFVQFHPTGMVWPSSVRGLLVTEAVRGEGGILLNATGDRFMERYDPVRMELSTRDVIARAIYKEVHEGRGSPHGGAYLTIAHKPAPFVRAKLPSMYQQFLSFAGVDITREAMEVFPTTHYAASASNRQVVRPRYPVCSPSARLLPVCTGQTALAAILFRTCSSSAGALARRPERTRARLEHRCKCPRFPLRTLHGNCLRPCGEKVGNRPRR